MNAVTIPASPKEQAYSAVCNAVFSHAPMRDIMYKYMLYIIACKDGNKTHAAKTLLIDRRSLQRWLIANTATPRGRF